MTAEAVAVDKAAAEVIEQGWTILHGAVPAPLLSQLRNAVLSTTEQLSTRFGGNAFLGTRTQRVFNLLSCHEDFAEVPIFEPVLSVAEEILDTDLLLSSLTAVRSHPGQDAQPLHADDGSIPLARPHQPLAVVAIWALTDFTANNGGTRLVPGSHRSDRRPRVGEQADTIAVEMPAGSVLVYNGSLWHGGGSNEDDAERMFIVCNYCAGWLRQEESQLLGLDRTIVASFAPRLRRLVGYGTYRGLQGHVAGVDPGSWFDDEVESDLVWNRLR